jgi:hypothetical protein
MKYVAFVLAGVLAIGCSSSDDAPAGDAGPADANTLPPADSYSVQWGPITVQPGVEDVRCVVKRLGNDVPAKINVIHNVLGDVSHHLILYRTPETVEQLEPTPCGSVENLVDPDNGLPLMITQKSDDRLTLPQGVAFEMDANQMIRMELHYINASDQPKEIMVTSTFTPIADADFEHSADLLFIGNPDISIAPNSAATLGPSFFPLPWGLDEAYFFGITGHEHQWGTDVRVETVANETGPGTSMYALDSFNWNEPETVYHDPPFQVPAEGGFRFTCDWENRSNRWVGFGEGVNDEMCFFWTYYYPSKGALTCFHTEQAGNGVIDVCCPGHQLCNVVQDYLDNL